MWNLIGIGGLGCKCIEEIQKAAEDFPEGAETVKCYYIDSHQGDLNNIEGFKDQENGLVLGQGLTREYLLNTVPRPIPPGINVNRIPTGGWGMEGQTELWRIIWESSRERDKFSHFIGNTVIGEARGKTKNLEGENGTHANFLILSYIGGGTSGAIAIDAFKICERKIRENDSEARVYLVPVASDRERSHEHRINTIQNLEKLDKFCKEKTLNTQILLFDRSDLQPKIHYKIVIAKILYDLMLADIYDEQKEGILNSMHETEKDGPFNLLSYLWLPANDLYRWEERKYSAALVDNRGKRLDKLCTWKLQVPAEIRRNGLPSFLQL